MSNVTTIEHPRDTLPAEAPRAVVAQRITPDDLLMRAMQSGLPMEQLERLLAMKERFDAAQARDAFTGAMSAFKSEPLEIFKRKNVRFETRDGDVTSYRHAELSDVCDVVVPAMARHGLSHRWDVTQESGRITVRCIVTHRAGHSEHIEMSAPPDASGKKNSIQQIASAVTYLQRYTLLAVTGMATKSEQDDDGAGAGDAGGAEEAGGIESPLLPGLRATKTDADALAYWNAHRGKLAADAKAYGRFKDAAMAHRRALAEGAAA